MSMTKEEFMKMAMGAQYSEQEEGLLDAMTMRRAREKVGAQYSENEMNQMDGYGDGSLMGIPQDTGAMTGAATTEAETDAFGIPIVDVDVPSLRRAFSDILSNITPMEQENVLNHWQRADDNGKIEFMKYIVENPDRAIGYGVQDETTDETTAPTVTNTSNLGFGDVAQGSEYYNDNFGIFMPSSYRSGYTGATGDERFKQGTDGYGFDSYPHGANRNYYNEKMFNNKFMPLNLGQEIKCH